MEPTKLVYRWNDTMESFVFAEMDRAIGVDKVHRAILKCITWEQLQKSVSPKDYEFLVELYFDRSGNEHDPVPVGEIDWAFFDTDLYSQAIFPSFLIYEMEDIIPEAILKEFGGEEIITDWGSYRQIKPEKLVPLVSRLVSIGYEVLPAGDLVFDDFM